MKISIYFIDIRKIEAIFEQVKNKTLHLQTVYLHQILCYVVVFSFAFKKINRCGKGGFSHKSNNIYTKANRFL